MARTKSGIDALLALLFQPEAITHALISYSKIAKTNQGIPRGKKKPQHKQYLRSS
jgi:hypothetical protein